MTTDRDAAAKKTLERARIKDGIRRANARKDARTPREVLSEALEHLKQADALMTHYQRATSYGHHAKAAVSLAYSEVSSEQGAAKRR